MIKMDESTTNKYIQQHIGVHKHYFTYSIPSYGDVQYFCVYVYVKSIRF